MDPSAKIVASTQSPVPQATFADNTNAAMGAAAATVAAVTLAQTENKNRFDKCQAINASLHSGTMSPHQADKELEAAHMDKQTRKTILKHYGDVKAQVAENETLLTIASLGKSYKENTLNTQEFGTGLEQIGLDPASINKKIQEIKPNTKEVYKSINTSTTYTGNNMRGGGTGYQPHIIDSINLAVHRKYITSQESENFLNNTGNYKHSSEFLHIIKKCFTNGIFSEFDVETILIQNDISDPVPSIMRPGLDSIRDRFGQMEIGASPSMAQNLFRNNTGYLRPVPIGCVVFIGVFSLIKLAQKIYRIPKIYYLPSFIKVRERNKSEMEKKIDFQSIDLKNINNTLSAHTKILTEIKENKLNTNLHDN